MTVRLLALDYRRLPPALRADAVLPEPETPTLLRQLARGPAVAEVAVVATCHRVEIYAITTAPQEWESAVWALLSWPAGADPWRRLAGAEAVRHLSRLACGLESSVVGEAQILGQVRRAWREASAGGTVGPIFDRLFRVAISAGKRARALTAGQERPPSLAHVAVRLASRTMSLGGSRTLVVGAGAMARSAVESFLAAGVSQIVVAARDSHRAATLDPRVTVASLESLPDLLDGVEVVLTATTAPGYRLDVSMVRRAMAGRGRRLTLVDMAVPPDIDPHVRDIAGVTLIDADMIAAEAPQVAALPAETLDRIEGIAREAAGAFTRWEHARAVVPTIVGLRRRAEEIRRAELARALRRLPDLDDRERAVVAALTGAIVSRLFHAPTVRLAAEAARGDGETLRRALETLFALERER